MTTELEDQLTAGMAEQTAGLTLTTDIMGAAKRRHGRRTAMFRTAYVTAALGLAGIVTVVATAPKTSQPPAVTAQSPALQLAAAVAASDNISYKLKITGGWVKGPGQLSSFSPLEGAFDPATVTGYLKNADGTLEERLIGGTLYSLGTSDTSEPFLQSTSSHQALQFTKVLASTGLQSADLQQLLQALQQANATITQNPGGGFHYQTATGSGDITLDGNGRIAKVTWDMTATEGGTTVRGQVTIELADYGTTVQVETPANVRLYNE